MSRYVFRLGLLVALLMIVLPVIGQETEPTPRPVTYDEVNAVAEGLYCPICENEPLETCGTATCVQWREEIREQLAAGRTPDEIADYFVANYGDRVLGMPEKSSLRILSLLGPVLVGGIAVLIAVWTFLRWRGEPPENIRQNTETTDDDNDYRSRLESDLQY